MSMLNGESGNACGLNGKTSLHPLIKKAIETNRNLTEPEAYTVIKHYGIPVPPYDIAKNQEEAIRISKSIGFPVVMKIVSSDILHKSDVGGVRLAVASEKEAEQAYQDILDNVKKILPHANINGILIAKSVENIGLSEKKTGSPDIFEVIIGAVKDPEFGFAVMFGLGGIFTEIVKDVSFRITPVSRSEILKMMLEIKGSQILEGARGSTPRDKEALVDIIMALSRLVQDNPSITSIDLNPVLSFAKGACVVDAKIIC